VAAYEHRTTTTVRHEYVIPKESANWAEVGKAFSAAKQDMNKDAGPGVSYSGDDAVWVDADDENIIIYWEDMK
jgi:hypothetical protein